MKSMCILNLIYEFYCLAFDVQLLCNPCSNSSINDYTIEKQFPIESMAVLGILGIIRKLKIKNKNEKKEVST